MYRAADVCVVSSLHDGMNLVAKEFIASRSDEHGVLVLSEFTGAARELEHAVHVNPFAVDAFADALHAALLMPGDEQRRRMRALRARVGSHTVFDWANALLSAAVRRMEPCVDASNGAAAAASRRDRQRPRPRARRSRYQHRLAVPAALRQPVGVCAAARPGARRHVGVQAGRRLAAPMAGYVRNTNVLRTEIETARRPLRALRLRAAHHARACSVDAPIEICRLLRAARRARRACASTSIRGPITRAPTSRSSPRAQGVEVVGGPTRLYLSTNVPRAVPRSTASPIRIDRPMFFVAERRQAARGRFGAGRRERARADHSRLARLGQDLARCRRSRRSRCCARRCASSCTPTTTPARSSPRPRPAFPKRSASGRTWDYRFCWLRDAAFVVEALRRLSHLAEGEAFVRFLRDMADSGPLQPMYGITGKRDLHEEIVPNLRGYDGVRAGAHRQRRLRAAAARRRRRDGAVPRDDPHRSARGLGGSDARAAARASRRGGDRVVRARRHRPLGIPHAAAALHVLEGDVLGRRASRRRAGRIPRHARARARNGARGRTRSEPIILERAYNKELGFFTQALRRRVSRRVEPAAARDRPDRSARSRASARPCAPTRSCWRRTG